MLYDSLSCATEPRPRQANGCGVQSTKPTTGSQPVVQSNRFNLHAQHTSLHVTTTDDKPDTPSIATDGHTWDKLLAFRKCSTLHRSR